MQARVKRRGPRSYGGRRPTNSNLIDFHLWIRVSDFIEPRKYHYAPVAENSARGIPASVGHVFHVHEKPCCRVVNRCSVPTEEGVVLKITAQNKWPAIGQYDHSVAKHVPALRLRRYGVA